MPFFYNKGHWTHSRLKIADTFFAPFFASLLSRNKAVSDPALQMFTGNYSDSQENSIFWGGISANVRDLYRKYMHFTGFEWSTANACNYCGDNICSAVWYRTWWSAKIYLLIMKGFWTLLISSLTLQIFCINKSGTC